MSVELGIHSHTEYLMTALTVPSSAVRSLVACFSRIEDPRVERTRIHDLTDILILSVLAVIAGAEGWEDIREYGVNKEGFLRKFLQLQNGIPSEDTISRVMRMLRPSVVQDAFMDWVDEMQGNMGVKRIAIDGKSLRRSHDRSTARKMLHCVCAWSVENQLVLGEQAVDEKSNEITAIPKLLDVLDLKGATVTIDAMGCQKEIAAKIIDGGGHYVLGAKDNHPTLCDAIAAYFTAAHEEGFVGHEVRKHTTHEKGHGRVETRHYFQCEIPASMQRLTSGWSKMKTICQVINITIRDGKETSEVRYYISSLPLGVKRFAESARGHWGIENSLHWVLDVTFNEDQSRIRKDFGAENFGLLRRFAIGIINQDTSKGSVRKKRKRAAWNDDFLLTLIASMS